MSAHSSSSSTVDFPALEEDRLCLVSIILATLKGLLDYNSTLQLNDRTLVHILLYMYFILTLGVSSQALLMRDYDERKRKYNSTVFFSVESCYRNPSAV